MADPKKSFQLVNFEGQKPLKIVFGDSSPANNEWGYCDFDLDGNGNLRLISLQDYTSQATLKCVFTEKQPNGYGTHIYSLIGEKDVSVQRTSLMMDLTMAIMAMKLFADAQADKQNLTDDDLIATMGKLIVSEDDTDPSVARIQLSIITNSDVEVDVGVL